MQTHPQSYHNGTNNQWMWKKEQEREIDKKESKSKEKEILIKNNIKNVWWIRNQNRKTNKNEFGCVNICLSLDFLTRFFSLCDLCLSPCKPLYFIIRCRTNWKVLFWVTMSIKCHNNFIRVKYVQVYYYTYILVHSFVVYFNVSLPFFLFPFNSSVNRNRSKIKFRKTNIERCTWPGVACSLI